MTRYQTYECQNYTRSGLSAISKSSTSNPTLNDDGSSDVCAKFQDVHVYTQINDFTSEFENSSDWMNIKKFGRNHEQYVQTSSLELWHLQTEVSHLRHDHYEVNWLRSYNSLSAYTCSKRINSYEVEIFGISAKCRVRKFYSTFRDKHRWEHISVESMEFLSSAYFSSDETALKKKVYEWEKSMHRVE